MYLSPSVIERIAKASLDSCGLEIVGINSRFLLNVRAKLRMPSFEGCLPFCFYVFWRKSRERGRLRPKRPNVPNHRAMFSDGKCSDMVMS